MQDNHCIMNNSDVKLYFYFEMKNQIIR